MKDDREDRRAQEQLCLSTEIRIENIAKYYYYYYYYYYADDYIQVAKAEVAIVGYYDSCYNACCFYFAFQLFC